ncbi:YggS family pyridoxal phosphate-dependent enzyme [Gracilibacillus caseinilyticus]|uniref:Pyridoxal phosphate homeostasis protein n=1 Tax=Gracilibacillus caseinilyticus TaxID=2932256 RepID=A0ABY4EU51_9BACI|nr:YggS family pyridoxal phosphate-dependent enzyme [Gracilibacillus caseinilyticus]UOQ47947.1 YggS family pyridoxal phosphate-dependent enzyme [Gracilibacillus caseinilyticus]
MSVAENLAAINQQINQACEKTGRHPKDISIIGVTKYVSVERALEALEATISHFGENRIEGFLEKYEQIGSKANWHFIGTLQSRKVREVVDKVDYIHSLDRKSLAKEINKRADKPVDCFVQVNVSGEESKHGLSPAEVEPFIETLEGYSNIRVVGLMTMAPYMEDRNQLREIFRSLRKLRDQIKQKGHSHAPCTYLSMGMSNDYQIAVEEGATHIRIGSSLVGPYEE